MKTKSYFRNISTASFLLIGAAISATPKALAEPINTSATAAMPLAGITCEEKMHDGELRGWFDWENGSINKDISVSKGYKMQGLVGISTQGISYSIDMPDTHSAHEKHIVVDFNGMPIMFELSYESKFNNLRQYTPMTIQDHAYLEKTILGEKDIHLSDNCVISTKGSKEALKKSIEINSQRIKETSPPQA